MRDYLIVQEADGAVLRYELDRPLQIRRRDETLTLQGSDVLTAGRLVSRVAEATLIDPRPSDD